MAGIHMRFRTDRSHAAADHRRWLMQQPMRFHRPHELSSVRRTAPAQPGDTWRVHWYSPDTARGPVAGYDICCVQCGEVHAWTTALNCASRRPDGHCDHMGVGSCWTWTGSARRNTLTAIPSLHAINACGWHGWLRDGVLT